MFVSITFAAVAILAIGFLIFVHELGHFLVAKKVGIRVEAFALGFGPRVFGWKRGDTDYKLCLLPIGGYVKMAGELPSDESTGATDEFSSKTVGQRAWVVSAGVIMNVFVAFLLFPLAFMVGVPFDTPVVGHVTEGGPAWRADVRPGDEVVKVNDAEILDFTDIRLEFVFAKPDREATLVLRRDGQLIERRVKPVYNRGSGFNEIGVAPAIGTLSFGESKAAKAAGIEKTDKILSINGIPTWTMAGIGPNDPRLYSLYLDTTQPLRIEIERTGTRRIEIVEVAPDVGEIGETSEYRLGLEYCNTNVVEVIRDIGAAPSAAGTMGLEVGDRIVGIDKKPVSLMREADAVFSALSAEKKSGAGRPYQLEVERTVAGTKQIVVLGPKDVDPADLRRSFTAGVKDASFIVTPNSPAERGGLKSGDEIVEFAGKPVDASKSDARTAITESVVASAGKACALRVRRDGREIDITVTPEKRLYNKVLLDLAPYAIPQHRVSSSFVNSIGLGMRHLRYQGANILAFFRSVFTGRVSGKNVGGIITIAQVSYTYAQQGIGKVLFFMGVLSLNLAFLNILPIPVLDGGHLLFLILEKIKGRRISEKAMNIAFWIGFVLIIGLMLFVTFNDIKRVIQ